MLASRSRHLSGRRPHLLRALGAALAALGLVVTLATPAFAGEGQQGQGSGSVSSGTALADANKPSYWQAIYGGTCTKIDGSAIKSSSYTLPVGPLYTVLVVKAGAAQSTQGGDYNAVYRYPDGGSTYSAPTGTNGEVKQISHVIYCVGTGVTPASPQVTQPVCVDGGAANGSFQAPADTAGISYTSAGLVVTATAQPGFVLTAASGGWSGNGYQQTFTVHYVVPDCSTTPTTPSVVPADPTIVQPSCTATGEISGGSFTAPESTDAITYSVVGQVITATAEDGYLLGASDGWTRVSDTVRTFTVSYSGPTSCPQPPAPTTVSPVDPRVDQPRCDGLVLYPGEIVPVETDGIDYQVTEATVTATAEPGYVLGAAKGRWMGGDHVQTFTVTFDAAPTCGSDDPSSPEVANPVAPTVVQPGCDGPTAHAGSISPVTTEGITYAVTGTTVLATPQQGYVLGAATGGWTGDGKAQTYVVTFRATPSCGGTTPPPPVTPPVVINPSTLSLVKTVDSKSAKPGDVLTYRLTATVQVGPDEGVEAQKDVTIKDVVPAGTGYVAGSAVCTTTTPVARTVTCTPAYDATSNTVSATADDLLAVGDSLELSFRTRIASPAVVDGKALTTVVNTAVVGSGSVDGVSSNTVSTAVTDVEGVIVEKPPVQQPGTQAPGVVTPGAQDPGTVQQPATLPHTGASGRLMATGLLLLGLGLGLVLAGRRRGERAA